MREMVKTDIPWMPEISSDFSVGYVKQYFFVSKDLSNDGEPERVLKLARAGIVEKDVTTNEGQMAASYAGYNKVCVGDLLLNPMDLYSGANCNVSELNGVISPAYSNLRAKKTGTVVPKYYDYYFKSQYWLMAMFAHGKGVSFDNRWTLNNDALRSYEIPVAPYAMQQKIVDAIQDGEKKVDSLIANVQAQIEKLKAYKQSLITEVVTKGLDPNAPMKDSGVEWAPKIPANWEMSRIGLHYSIILGKMLCPKPADDSYTLEPYYCAANVHFGNICSDELKKMWFSPYEKELYHVEVGDVLIVEGGAGAGGCAVVQQPTETLVQNSVMIVRNKSNSDNRYLRYWVESLVGRGYIEVVCNKATIPHFTKEKLSRTVYPVMSPKEQVQIADFLDKKCSQIEQLITLKESKIEKLQQYKRSLIYEYVTGKKEVV